MKHARRTRRWIGQAVAWSVILVVVATLAVAVVIPRLAGATPYTVLTGSMEPDLPAGTLVVVRPSEQFALGDVITYQLESGKDTVVTHRVVGQGVSVKGVTTYLTQGDANNVPDAEPVKPVQIRGEVWYSVPYLGRFSNSLSNDQRRTATVVLVAALALYAAYMFTTSFREHRSRRPRDTTKERST